MIRKFSTRVVIGAVALGTVALGTTAGAAGAATATTPKPAHHFDCSRAPKALARIQAAESQIAAGLPRLHAAQTKAQQNGNAKRAERVQKRISRMESPAYKARLEKRKARIQAACQGSTPAPNAAGAATTA